MPTKPETDTNYPDMSRTRAALEEFDNSQAARDRMLEAAGTAEQVMEWIEVEDRAIKQVKEAFAADTADRNSRDNAMLAGLTFIRQCVAGWEVQR